MATRISKTLSFYLAKHFALNLLFMCFILLGIIWIFDVAELLRRGADNDVPLVILAQMGFLKLPEMAQTLFPFIVLFAALFSFWQLAKRSELVVLRASGISVWQFLRPVFVVSFAAGLFVILILNPLSAVFFQKFSSLEERYILNNSLSRIALFEEGLWLKQPLQNNEYTILHAEKIELPKWKLENVMVLFFDAQNNFVKRMDARTAQLLKGRWKIENLIEHQPNGAGIFMAQSQILTDLTPTEIEKSFSTPETMGFWSLPNFIKTLERTGFDSTKLRIHFHALLALPLLCCAMVLLASAVALRPQRSGQNFLYILSGVGIGFGLFFFSSFLQALGAQHHVPVFLAAWAPTMLALLSGTSYLLAKEDG